MLRTYLYIPEHLREKINHTARNQKKSKAEILREAIKKGLEKMEEQNASGAEALLEIAEMAKKLKVKGPKDASLNHDYYLWGLPKKKS